MPRSEGRPRSRSYHRRIEPPKPAERASRTAAALAPPARGDYRARPPARAACPTCGRGCAIPASGRRRSGWRFRSGSFRATNRRCSTRRSRSLELPDRGHDARVRLDQLVGLVFPADVLERRAALVVRGAGRRVQRVRLVGLDGQQPVQDLLGRDLSGTRRSGRHPARSAAWSAAPPRPLRSRTRAPAPLAARGRPRWRRGSSGAARRGSSGSRRRRSSGHGRGRSGRSPSRGRATPPVRDPRAARRSGRSVGRAAWRAAVYIVAMRSLARGSPARSCSNRTSAGVSWGCAPGRWSSRPCAVSLHGPGAEGAWCASPRRRARLIARRLAGSAERPALGSHVPELARTPMRNGSRLRSAPAAAVPEESVCGEDRELSSR